MKLLGTFLNLPREWHSAGFGYFCGFVSRLLGDEFLIIPFLIVLSGLGGYALLDMAGLRRPIVWLKKFYRSDLGQEVKKEMQYFAGFCICGYISALLLVR
jgi:hypothetical protein